MSSRYCLIRSLVLPTDQSHRSEVLLVFDRRDDQWPIIKEITAVERAYSLDSLGYGDRKRSSIDVRSETLDAVADAGNRSEDQCQQKVVGPRFLSFDLAGRCISLL